MTDLDGHRILTGEQIMEMVSPEALASKRTIPIEGYSLGSSDLEGKALLSGAWGYDLVLRLKDTRPLLTEEIFFWAGLLSRIKIPAVDFITAPPSNGKVPAHEHLASILGSMVAWHKKGVFRQLLWSPRLRSTRGNMQSKMDERASSPYFYYGPATGAKILVVDDAAYTRSTAMRCNRAIKDRGDVPIFLILYRS